MFTSLREAASAAAVATTTTTEVEANAKGKKNAKVEPKAKAKGKVHCQGPKAKTNAQGPKAKKKAWVGECLEIHSGSKAGNDFQQKGADPSMQNHFLSACLSQNLIEYMINSSAKLNAFLSPMNSSCGVISKEKFAKSTWVPTGCLLGPLVGTQIYQNSN